MVWCFDHSSSLMVVVCSVYLLGFSFECMYLLKDDDYIFTVNDSDKSIISHLIIHSFISFCLSVIVSFLI